MGEPPAEEEFHGAFLGAKLPRFLTTVIRCSSLSRVRLARGLPGQDVRNEVPVGAIADAEVEFRAVLARDPKSGDAHHNLALVLTITDRLDEAEREIAAAEKAGAPVT